MVLLRLHSLAASHFRIRPNKTLPPPIALIVIRMASMLIRILLAKLRQQTKGAMEIIAAERLLTAKSDAPAKLTAPASGLFLERVYYAGDARTFEVPGSTFPVPGSIPGSRFTDHGSGSRS